MSKYITLKERLDAAYNVEQINEMGLNYDITKSIECALSCDFHKDNPDDMILIPKTLIPKRNVFGVTYWFGYIYNQKSDKWKEFQNFRNNLLKKNDFKKYYEKEYYEFISNPIWKLIEMKKFENLKAVFYIKNF